MSSVKTAYVRNLTNTVPDALSIGQGQTWQNLTASRAAGTTYTNTTGRSICVAIIESGDGAKDFRVDGVIVGYSAGVGIDGSIFAIVPAGSTYLYTAGQPFVVWSELR